MIGIQRRRREFATVGILGMLFFASCSNDCVDLDTRAPSPVVDLTVSRVTHNSAELAWIAPGDDDLYGQAFQYDIRYARFEITDASWEDAVCCEDEPSPGAAGTDEFYTVSDLSDFTEYSFAIKAADEVPNWSGLSNVATCRTAIFDTTPPVIDSIVVPCVPDPVPCHYISIYAHDEAAYPEAVTPPESLEFWYRLIDPTGTTTCESEPEWDRGNHRLAAIPCITIDGVYVFECKARDKFLNETDLATAEFSALR
jgi:hypothetical protein